MRDTRPGTAGRAAKAVRDNKRRVNAASDRSTLHDQHAGRVGAIHRWLHPAPGIDAGPLARHAIMQAHREMDPAHHHRPSPPKRFRNKFTPHFGGESPPSPRKERMDADFFRNVWKATGLPGKPPPVYQGGVRGYGHLGEQPFANREVHLDPWVAHDLRQYGVPGAPRYRDAMAVLLHEYAHTAQPRVQKRTGAGIEGGAEAWAKRNLPRIMRRFAPGQNFGDLPVTFTAYSPWTRKVNRNPVYRDYGQFGRRP